ncbi:MAG TPA: hypothetical protein VF441_05760 [Acidimicrobiia bacterium]
MAKPDEPAREPADEPTLAEKLDRSVANYRAKDEQFVLRASPWRRVMSSSPRRDVRAHWVSDAVIVLDLPAGPMSLRPLRWIRAYYEDLPAQFGAPAVTSHDGGPTA